ncbi:MAG: AraC family transcriptional regulator [Betaproteobacteria bacterium]|nr:AraC family transcriptional regulator [Betaproteobacteria bacterium]
MKTATRAHYARRIDKVVMYLADHLDDQLDLHRLAEEAHLSPYHFHRVYVAMTGETVAETVRRQRLHRASIKLIASAAPLAKLAAEAGYGSVQAFNRAFREAYGLPPAAYRRRGEQMTLAANIRNSLRQPPLIKEPLMYPVSIQTRPAHRVATLAHKGHYHEIGPTFERLAIWAAGRGALGPATASFGIYYDDPDSVAPEALRSDACISVAANFVSDAEHPVKTIAGGRHAVLLHTGPYSELHLAWRWVYSEWLPKSGEAPGDAPPYEHYLNDPRGTPPAELKTAICIPLKG